jgi:hypothetical protein
MIGLKYKTIKEYRMVFRAGLRDPYTRDVARLSESVKILEPQASVFLRFPKVEQHRFLKKGINFPRVIQND